MTNTEAIVISIAVILALVIICLLAEPLRRKIEKYKFKKQCQKYAKEGLKKVKNEPFEPTPAQVNNWGRNFESLRQSVPAREYIANSPYLFSHGELKELVLKHIKNRKGITVIKLGVLIPEAKENSIRKCLARLRVEGIIESRRIGKTKYVQYYLKKDIDTVAEE